MNEVIKNRNENYEIRKGDDGIIEVEDGEGGNEG